MKHIGRLALGLAGGLVLQWQAVALTPEGGPYATIVSQNVFRLQSPTLNEPAIPPIPPPKITLLGIVSGHGPKQVMFKYVAGTPPKEFSCVLGENELADGVEVIEIMERTGLVRLRNHGQDQTLSLEKDGMKPGGISKAPAANAATRPSPINDARATDLNRPRTPAMTAEEQMVLMEVNRKLSAKQIESGQMPPLPPTPITGK